MTLLLRGTLAEDAAVLACEAASCTCGAEGVSNKMNVASKLTLSDSWLHLLDSDDAVHAVEINSSCWMVDPPTILYGLYFLSSDKK